jgi:hypothetical protein
MGMFRVTAFALTVAGALSTAIDPALAFCGFYVARADGRLFNKASKVVLARNGATTAITMASDYEGDPKDFALVIPVPTVVKESDIHVVDQAMLDRLDNYSEPRLVEYTDPDPCAPPRIAMAMDLSGPRHDQPHADFEAPRRSWREGGGSVLGGGI